MRYYHFRRFYVLAFALISIGGVAIMGSISLGMFRLLDDHSSTLLFFAIPGCLAFVGVSIQAVATFWLQLRLSGTVRGPQSPEGVRVDPTGIWVNDDTPLPVGCRVLAFSEDGWYRAIVIAARSRDRVEIHFTGWDSFWDEIRPRKSLQIYPALPIDEGTQPGDKTAIREG